MGFSNEWDERYKENTHMSIWPWSDIVSYVMRYAKPQKEGLKVLEIGFGAGANIPFFKKLKADYHGIEGSSVMVEKLKKEYPEYADNLLCGDFTKDIPFNETFDLIIDRAAITHNDTVSIERTLNMVYEKLSKNGKFIGIDWFSKAHSGYNNISEIIDDYTKTNFEGGYFKDLGVVHFSDKNHLIELLKKFNLVRLEHKHNEYLIPNEEQKFAAFNFLASKRTK